MTTTQPDPGQLAYETRFAGFTLGQNGVAPPWADVPPIHRAIWQRVENAIENRAADMIVAALKQTSRKASP